jgi:putative nucleotidyltransferase with HDIG domain
LRSPDDVFAGGLLHDIGKLIHAVYLTEEFSAVVAEVNECGVPMVTSERRVIGYDHTYTGKELAIRWNLSEGTIDMIAHHHLSDPATTLTKEIAAVYLGNIFSIALGLGAGGEKKVPIADTNAWDILGIELSHLESIITRIDKVFAESIAILEA